MSALFLGPLLLVADVTHVAHVVSKCDCETGYMSCTSLPFCFSCELHTLTEKAKKATEMIMLKACTF